MSADQKTPGPYKKAYDIFGLLTTQLSFAYLVSPFIILDFKNSLQLWARAYVSLLLPLAVPRAQGN